MYGNLCVIDNVSFENQNFEFDLIMVSNEFKKERFMHERLLYFAKNYHKKIHAIPTIKLIVKKKAIYKLYLILITD